MVNISRISRNLFRCTGIPIRLTQPSLEIYTDLHVVVDFLFIVTPIVGVCNCSMFCCTLLYLHSSIAVILMGKRELVALLNMSSWCLVMVEQLFLMVPRCFVSCGTVLECISKAQ